MYGALALDLLAIGAAPWLDRHAERWPAAYDVVRTLARLAVVAIVLFEILPEGWAVAGYRALVAVAAGLALPFALERRSHETTSTSLAGTFFALGFHHLLDGVGLGQADAPLGAAVVLHTLPVALLGWRLAARERGQRAGVTLLVSIAACTVIGFAMARLSLDPGGQGTALMACFLGGWLVHALGHREHDHAGHVHSHSDSPV